MSTPISAVSLCKDPADLPLIHLFYECITQEQGREKSAYLYEIACSITYPVAFGYLSLKVTGQNTYLKRATREVPFTSHALGATTYLELLEAEQLEVRVIAYQGAYSKALYTARKQKLSELYTRHIVSSIDQIAPDGFPVG